MKLRYNTMRKMENGQVVEMPSIVCRDAYEQREILKGLGFSYKAESKAWWKSFKTISPIGDTLIDVIMQCGLSYADFTEFYEYVPNGGAELTYSADKITIGQKYFDEHC